MANCWRGQKSFRMKDILSRHLPYLGTDDGMTIYLGSAMPEVDWERLIYFGLSVFWRAGAHEWSNRHRTLMIDLGENLEPLRLFLLDQGHFPGGAELIVRVNTLEPFRPSMGGPESFTEGEAVMHGFRLLGLTFMLRVGYADVGSPFNTAPSPDRFIGTAPAAEWDALMISAGRYYDARDRGLPLNPPKAGA